jgi:hypothetical protein
MLRAASPCNMRTDTKRRPPGQPTHRREQITPLHHGRPVLGLRYNRHALRIDGVEF